MSEASAGNPAPHSDPTQSAEGSLGSDLDPVALLVCECLERFEDEGSSAIESVCDANPSHAAQIRQRLSSLQRLGLLPEPDSDGAEVRLPERIGPYEVLRQVGRGGMGVVFEAQQDSPRRRVALKVMRSGFLTDTALRRFATETQLLGLLQHAHIAQIYEAGTTQMGGEALPYFAMEFVDGVPITLAVRREEADLRRRLDLLAKVAEAIDYAHGRGVIHRDLKPGNILVDERGEPKVLDFGLARASDPELSLTSVNTKSGQVLGTLAYMSPEQARGDSHHVDRATDVYSLGVLGYELLAHELPYSVRDLNMLEAVRVVCETEPRPLGAGHPELRGDVETIFSTALEKDPARRYASAGAMAADIRRFLSDEPILARPPSTWYQLSKAVRRNQGLFGGIAAAFVLLILGTTVSTVQWIRARAATRDATEAQVLEAAARESAVEALAREAEQRRRADAARRTAEQAREVEEEQREKAEAAEALAQRKAEVATSVTGLLTRMLNSPDPWTSSGLTEFNRDTKVVDVLDATARGLDERDDLDPEVEAEVRSALAQTYDGLGFYEQSLVQAQRALELFRASLGEDSPQVTMALSQVALGHRGLSQLEQARELLEETVRRFRQSGLHHAAFVTALSDLALMHSDLGDTSLALELLHEAREIVEASSSPAVHERLHLIHHNLGSILQENGQLAEARPFLESALRLRTERMGAHHPRTLAVQNALGQILSNQGDFQGAIELQSDLLAKAEAGVGTQHPFYGTLLVNLAQTYLSVGETARGRELFQQAVDAADAGALYTDLVEVRALAGLANGLVFEGKIEQARERALDAIDLSETSLGESHSMTALAYGVYGVVLLRSDDAPGAIEWLTRAVESYSSSIGPDSFSTVNARETLTSLQWHFGDLRIAAELAAENVERSLRCFAGPNAHSLRLRLMHADILAELEDDELELQLLEAFEESQDVHGRDAAETTRIARRLLRYYEGMQLEEDAAEFRAFLGLDPDDDGR